MENLEGHVWIQFVEPFVCKGHLLETKFWLGQSLCSAREVHACETGDNSESLHLNWPLRVEEESGRRHAQVLVHRLLAMTFLYVSAHGLPPYHTLLVVDHRDKNHSCSLLNNLRLFPKPDHDSLKRRRKL